MSGAALVSSSDASLPHGTGAGAAAAPPPPAAAAARPVSSPSSGHSPASGDVSQLPPASAELRSVARLLKSSMKGGVPALVRGMRGPGNLEDPALQEVACVTLASIVVRNPAAKAQVAAAGGIEAAVEALYTHPLNPGLQEAGCKALANTVANCSGGTEVRAANAGALHAVLAALTNHHDAAYVVEAACAALANLTANSASARALLQQRPACLPSHLPQPSFFPASFLWFSLHHGGEEEEEDSLLPRCILQVRDLAGPHAVEAVLEAMRDYPDHLGVMGAASQALANLVALNHASNQRAALAGGGVEAILGLIAEFNRTGGARARGGQARRRRRSRDFTI